MKHELNAMRARLQSAPRAVEHGRVVRAVGVLLESRGPRASIGDICVVAAATSVHETRDDLLAEVVGFRDDLTLLMLLGDPRGIAPGCIVTATGAPLRISVGDGVLGRVLDGLGQPADEREPWLGRPLTVECPPPPPLQRRPIREPLTLGVRAIDGLLSCGKGQRLGIFAGSGVGKSTLLTMMARNTNADVIVLSLVGERGREVGEFVDKLDPATRARSVVVAGPPIVPRWCGPARPWWRRASPNISATRGGTCCS